MFEHAKWIGRERDLEERPAPLLRKEFTVSQPVKEARLYVCGLGYGIYYLNGSKVTEDVLTTPFTQYDKTVLYTSYPVTDLIRQGSNVIGVILGNGFYNDVGKVWGFEKASWRHSPKVILQLEIIFTDNTVFVLNSDSLFRTADSPIVYNHARCGEKYDARLEIPGWVQPGFDDSSWKRAVIANSPGGVIKEADIPPIREIERLKPVKVHGKLYDFGKNISGYAEVETTGTKGTEISLIYSDRITEDGHVDTYCVNQFNLEEVRHTDTYILKGDGKESWKPSFVYHGFRYVEVVNAPAEFTITAIRVHTDLKSHGDFRCSDEMLNRIHQACRLSTLTNFFGIPTDCPHREQNGWTGDAQISCEQSIMNFDMLCSYRKWMRDFKDVQRPSGQVPAIVPTTFFGFQSGGPAWDSAIILIPYYIYHLLGDITVAQEMWDNMDRYLFYVASLSEDDLLIDYYSLWDWCTPPNAAVCPKEITDNAFFYSDAMKMAVMAEALGKDSTKYRELASRIKKAFRRQFLKDGIIGNDSQTSIACGIYEGLYEKEEIPAAAAHLAELVKKNGYHTDCGILGIKYSLNALSENGYADVVYRMITNPTMPSYAYWINQGMTTLCEDWAMVNCNGEQSSLNHHMFSEVDMWFYKYVAGIRLTEDGLHIQPCFLKGLDWVKASHQGICVEWDLEKVNLTLDRPAKVIIEQQIFDLSAGRYCILRDPKPHLD